MKTATQTNDDDVVDDAADTNRSDAETHQTV
jgi:hypothetical protein